MASSWLIIERDGRRKSVDLRTNTRQGVLRAVRRATRAGQTVTAAFLGRPGAIALCPKVYPA